MCQGLITLNLANNLIVFLFDFMVDNLFSVTPCPRKKYMHVKQKLFKVLFNWPMVGQYDVIFLGTINSFCKTTILLFFLHSSCRYKFFMSSLTTKMTKRTDFVCTLYVFCISIEAKHKWRTKEIWFKFIVPIFRPYCLTVKQKQLVCYYFDSHMRS